MSDVNFIVVESQPPRTIAEVAHFEFDTMRYMRDRAPMAPTAFGASVDAAVLRKVRRALTALARLERYSDEALYSIVNAPCLI